MQKKLFGIVEGFFSSPLPLWSNSERISIIQLLAEQPSLINAYLYCPKNDVYVTSEWATLYTQKNIKPIIKAARLCSRTNINFYYGLNPTLTDFSERSSKNTARKIIKKLEQLRTLGIDSFCLLFDDIPFAYNILADEKSIRDAQAGAAQAIIANVVYDWLGNKPGALLVCSSEYFFTRKTKFLEAFDSTLKKDIPVLWTGSGVYEKNLGSSTVVAAQNSIAAERPLIWWNNYPVNDCEHIPGTFHFGAFNGPPIKAFQKLDGIFVNPMREAMLNIGVLATFKQYLENPRQYNRDRALRVVCTEKFGKAGRALYRLGSSFADKNTVDAEPREYAKKILAVKTNEQLRIVYASINADQKLIEAYKKNDADSAWGSFCLYIAMLLKPRIKAAMQVAQTNKAGFEKITEPLLRFPVVTEKRYLTKIYKTIMDRQRMISAWQNFGNVALLNAISNLGILYGKYNGKNRLSISSSDEAMLRKNIKITIRKQKELLVKYCLVADKIKKIKTLIRWWNMNGY